MIVILRLVGQTRMGAPMYEPAKIPSSGDKQAVCIMRWYDADARPNYVVQDSEAQIIVHQYHVDSSLMPRKASDEELTADGIC